ncbi:MAG: tagatose 1,6-diphosphate aldolase [Acidobacteriaceae bacterium]
MSNKLTPGKIAGLKAVSDKRGVIAAAAMDQRGLLKNMLAKEMGVEEPPESMVVQFKELVTEALTRHASAILLDVQYGLPATKHRNGKGLLLAYEKAGYTVDHPERLPTATEGWSVLRLKEAGADSIKILLYYTPFENNWINEQKHAWVERIGAECRANDIPLFLEFVGYDVHGEAEKGLAYARRKPEIVICSIKEFSQERYGADVLKVEVPVQMQFVEGTQAYQGQKAYTRSEAMEHFRVAASATPLPFVYLSAGVSSPVFLETLEFAVECGVSFNGVLCGRATWQDGVPIYVKDGAAAFEDWLNTQGAENIQQVNNVLKSARPWYEKLGAEALALP